MKTSFLRVLSRDLIISLIVFWFDYANCQDNKLAVGVGAGYNFTPVLYDDDGSYWFRNYWPGNFTPIIAVRYGNKISGVFKASYIQNSFEQSNFGQYYPTSMNVWKAKFHQIHTDFLFEHSPFGSKGFFYYLGPGIGIPVKVNMSAEYWREAYYIYPAEHTYKEYNIQADYKLYVEGIFGIGGYIPIKEKNLIRIESNVRIGLQKVTITLGDDHEARMVAFQLILGYLRRL